MFQRRWLRFVAVLLGLTLLAAACGSDDKSDSSSDTTGTASAKKIGLVYDIGGRGDQSFNDAAYTGLQKAKDELGVTVQDLEPDSGGQDREDLLRTLADQDYDMIIGVGFNFVDSIKKVAADYPKISFAIIDDDTITAPNVTDLVFSEEQGSYLVGAAAALTSKTGKLGFIGGVHVDLIKKFEAGFVAGAQKVKPNASVDVKYITEPPDFDGFRDPAKAKEIALAQYGSGIDVIFHAAGGSGGGLFDAAKQVGGVWAIGVDSDQYKTADAAVRDTILTSMIKRVDVAVYDAIKEFTAGTLKAGVQRFDLKNDGIAFSTSGDKLTPDIITQVNALKAQIVSGEIEVPTTP